MAISEKYELDVDKGTMEHTVEKPTKTLREKVGDYAERAGKYVKEKYEENAPVVREKAKMYAHRIASKIKEKAPEIEERLKRGSKRIVEEIQDKVKKARREERVRNPKRIKRRRGGNGNGTRHVEDSFGGFNNDFFSMGTSKRSNMGGGLNTSFDLMGFGSHKKAKTPTFFGQTGASKGGFDALFSMGKSKGKSKSMGMNLGMGWLNDKPSRGKKSSGLGNVSFDLMGFATSSKKSSKSRGGLKEWWK